MESRSCPDYLIIGHVSHDLIPDGFLTGGTVSFSGLAAQALGCQTCVVTSAGPDFDPERELPGLAVHTVPSAETTTFDNIYSAEGRRQYIYRWAGSIRTEDVPTEWRCAPIVHLAPVANELDSAIITAFPDSKVGITPQGWLRKWDETRKIRYKSWLPDVALLSKASVLIISEEDIPFAEPVQYYRDHVPVVVQTRSKRGCVVYQGNSRYEFTAPPVREVNPTGAGDIFTTAFMIRLHQTESIEEAAVFANKVAAWSVTARTLSEKIAVIRERLQSDL